MAALSCTLSMKIPQAPSESRSSLAVALTSAAASRARTGVERLFTESLKFVDSTVERISKARSLEEALMTVPDLETIPYRVVSKREGYEIRQVESYLAAETDMPGGFDFVGSSVAFNTIASYIFGKNSNEEEMAMTTPVLSTRDKDEASWRMAFLMPLKYNEETLPEPGDQRVRIRRVPSSLMAVTSFSGTVSDKEVKERAERLRRSVERDGAYRVKAPGRFEVAQYNPPFTPPLFRRNEVAIEVEFK